MADTFPFARIKQLFNATALREASKSTAMGRYVIAFTVMSVVYLPLSLATVSSGPFLKCHTFLPHDSRVTSHQLTIRLGTGNLQHGPRQVPRRRHLYRQAQLHDHIGRPDASDHANRRIHGWLLEPPPDSHAGFHSHRAVRQQSGPGSNCGVWEMQGTVSEEAAGKNRSRHPGRQLACVNNDRRTWN